jgi:glucose-1-phosphate thymidylyltransferase
MKTKIIGLIPAAGKGSRLGLPFPKELYPINIENNYKPVAEFIIDNLISAGIDHICFVINETKHQLIGYFGNGEKFGCRFSYVYQDFQSNKFAKSPGLAQAIDASYHLIKGQRVYFGMPDTIISPKNVFQIMKNTFQKEIDVLLGLFVTNTPEKFGMVETDNNKKVNKIIDKPIDSSLTKMWGCIVWGPKFSEFLHESVEKREYDFANILNLAINKGLNVQSTFFPEGNYIDVGTFSEVSKLIKIEF